MFFRLLYQSFRRQRRRKLLAGLAVALGIAVATAMVALATDVGDKISHELRRYGANLVVFPEADTLDVEIAGKNLKPPSDNALLLEKDLPRVKHIFWGNNILAFTPWLEVSATLEGPANASLGEPASIRVIGTYFSKEVQLGDRTFATGIPKTHPWWKVVGRWPSDELGQDEAGQDEALVGEKLAARLEWKNGDEIRLSTPALTAARPLKIVGILSSGGDEGNEIIVPLPIAQALRGAPGAYEKLYVSALTKPEDSFARRDPAQMSPAMHDRWYCSPYANSIAFQLREAIPHAGAEQIRQVAQNEGGVLSRISGLMWLISLAALTAAALAVSSAMAATVFERRREVGLMKSLGATNSSIATLFFSEAAVLAITAGIIGFAAGSLLARRIGLTIFDSTIDVHPVLLPLVLLAAVGVTFAGSVASIGKAMQFDPAVVLRGSDT